MTVEEAGALNSEYGLTRREFVKRGAAGAAGIALAGNGLVTRVRATARARSVILLWMDGGPSHLDTFDPKVTASGTPHGEFGAIRTTVPGTCISELLPRMAGQMHRCVLIRTVSHNHLTHERACQAMLTGAESEVGVVQPSIGSIACLAARYSGSQFPYVAIPGATYGFGFGRAGFLGEAYDPQTLSGDEWRDVHSVVAEASDLRKEPDRTVERYGRSAFGRGCLIARRLVARGARFVTVSQGGWDTHSDNAVALKGWLAPQLDAGMSTLLEELHQTGLLSETLVVWMGEFGRNPEMNALAGRDHWPAAGCALFAGAGMPEGLVIGSTDRTGKELVERPVSPAEIAATILARLAIDRESLLQSCNQRVARAAASPIAELA